MRNNFLQPDWISQDLDSAHSFPISQMGNYQEYLKKQTPQLREIESAPVRQHMFGNPFKIDKRMMVSVSVKHQNIVSNKSRALRVMVLTVLRVTAVKLRPELTAVS